MKSFNTPFPENESDRLKALKNYNIMDSLSEEEYDDITKLVSKVCNTPISLISLLDEKRQWFKSKVGLDVEETPRDISFCQYAILDKHTFQVPNALEDPIFANNPLVTGFPYIRFYAGMPLTDPDGFNLGTLCVIDTVPKKLTEEQVSILELLAKEVVSLIVLRKKNKDIEESKNELDLIISSLQEGVIFQGIDGKVAKLNSSAEIILETTIAEIAGKSVLDMEWLFYQENGDILPDDLCQLVITLETKKSLSNVIIGIQKTPTSIIKWISINTVLIFNGDQVKGVITTFKDISERRKKDNIISKNNLLLSKTEQISKTGSWEFDLSTFDLIWSKEHYRIFEIEENCPKEELYNLYRSKIHPDDLIVLDDIVKNAQEKGIGFTYEHRVVIENKPIKYAVGIGEVELDSDGKPIRLRGTVQDITERKLLKMKTEENLQKLNEAQFISKIGSWEFNFLTKESIWSEQQYRIFEIEYPQTPDELHRQFKAKIDHDENERVEAIIAESIKNKTDFQFQQIINLDGGKKINILETGKLILNNNGEVIKIIGTSQDITERILVDQELLKTKESLEKISEISQIGGWELNLVTNELNWTSITKQIHEEGPDFEPNLETAINYYKEGYSRDLMIESINNAIKLGHPYEIDVQIITKHKNEIWVRAKGTAIFENEKCIALSGTFQDIDLLVKMNETSNTNNKRLAFALEATGDGIWDWNPITQKTYYSPRWLDILGYSSTDFSDSDQEWSSRIHPDDISFTFDLIGQNLKGEIESFEHEYRFQNKLGEYIWILNKGKVVERNKDGEAIRLIGTHTDISERKKEEKLKDLITNLSKLIIDSTQLKENFDLILKDLLEITKSEYGFIGEVFYENEEPYLKTYALTNISWDQATRDFYDAHAPSGMEFRNLNTLFGYALKHKESVISNDPMNDTRRGGLPHGHPALNAFLGIPILHNDRLVGMIGIANKDGGYIEQDIEYLNPFTSTFSSIIHLIKTELERKNGDALLKRSEEMLYQTNKIAQVGAWEYNSKKEVFWSAITREIFEITDDFDLTVENYQQLYPSHSLEKLESEFKKSIDTGIPFDIELEILTFFNKSKWVRLIGDSEFKNGEFVRLFGAYQDITEQKANEAIIINSKNHFQALINHSPFCIHEINLEGQLISMNAAGLKMMGVDNFEEINKSLYLNAVCTLDRPRIEDLLKKAIKNEGSQFEFESGIGSIFKSNFVPILDESGSVNRLMGITEDITEKYNAEIELIAAKEKAELASIAKSDFLANMSHEIRTPLNGIIGFSDLLRTTELDATQEIFTKTIIQSSHSLLEIINDILDFSKIEAGKLELDIQKSDFYDVIYQAIDTVTFQAQTKELELLLYVDPSLSSHYYFDAIRTKQIIVNLLGNAIKFTSEGDVELRIERIKTEKQKSTIRFSIIDTGVGIEKGNQAKVFEAFSQADTSTTRKFGGTGLGLTISNKLLDLMGNSKLQLESELGKGSTFFFEVELEFDEETSSKEFNSGLSMLIINSSIKESKIIGNYLNYEDIQTDIVHSSADALEKISTNKVYDAVLFDSKIYNDENNQALTEFVNSSTFDILRTPMVLITRSVHDDTYFKECEKLGISHKITKPLKPLYLFEAISKIINTQFIEVEKVVVEKTIFTSKSKILIVDDNSINILLAKVIMKNLLPNAELIIAKNGQEAVEEYSKNKPDIIFMDVQMPILNGYEATAEIRKLETSTSTPIVGLTAGVINGEKERCLEAGMDNYISKPIIIEDLIEIIKLYIKN